MIDACRIDGEEAVCFIARPASVVVSSGELAGSICMPRLKRRDILHQPRAYWWSRWRGCGQRRSEMPIDNRRRRAPARAIDRCRRSSKAASVRNATVAVSGTNTMPRAKPPSRPVERDRHRRRSRSVKPVISIERNGVKEEADEQQVLACFDDFRSRRPRPSSRRTCRRHGCRSTMPASKIGMAGEVLQERRSAAPCWRTGSGRSTRVGRNSRSRSSRSLNKAKRNERLVGRQRVSKEVVESATAMMSSATISALRTSRALSPRSSISCSEPMPMLSARNPIQSNRMSGFLRRLIKEEEQADDCDDAERQVDQEYPVPSVWVSVRPAAEGVRAHDGTEHHAHAPDRHRLTTLPRRVAVEHHRSRRAAPALRRRCPAARGTARSG